MIQTISNQRLSSVHEDSAKTTAYSQKTKELAKIALLIISLGAVVYVAYRCGRCDANPEIEQLKRDIKLLNDQKEGLEEQLKFSNEYCSRELKLCEGRSERYLKMLLDDLRPNRTATQGGEVSSSRVDASMFLELWARFLGMYQ